MSSKNEMTKTPTLRDSIELTSRRADAQTMKAVIQDEYGLFAFSRGAASHR